MLTPQGRMVLGAIAMLVLLTLAIIGWAEWER